MILSLHCYFFVRYFTVSFVKRRGVASYLVGFVSVLGSAILPSCTEVKADEKLDDYMSVCNEFTKDRYYWLYYLLQWNFLGSLLKRYIFNKISEKKYRKSIENLCKDTIMSLFDKNPNEEDEKNCVRLVQLKDRWALQKHYRDDIFTITASANTVLSCDINGSNCFKEADCLIKAYRQLKNTGKLLKTLVEELEICPAVDRDENWYFYLDKNINNVSYLGKKLVMIAFSREPGALPEVSYTFKDEKGCDRIKNLEASDFGPIIDQLLRSKKGIDLVNKDIDSNF